jgi:RNA-directed DNA polymerase
VLEPEPHNPHDINAIRTAYGYRPGRSALEAVQEVHRALCAGHTEVIDADVSKYLDVATYCPLVHGAA